MKQFLYSMLLLTGVTFSAKSAVLFPFFVDIAPDYQEGVSAEFQAAGVECAMYHSTRPDFLVSTLSAVESFLKDTLPADVTRDEQTVGDCRLITYTSVNKKADTIETKSLKSTIRILSRPDKSYVAAYDEQEVDN